MSLKYITTLGFFFVSYTFLKYSVKIGKFFNIFRGNHLLVYSNRVNDIFFVLRNVKSKFYNFLPYGLLFNKFFISFDKFSLDFFISLSPLTVVGDIFYIIKNILFLSVKLFIAGRFGNS